jgi:hypothetical protein
MTTVKERIEEWINEAFKNAIFDEEPIEDKLEQGRILLINVWE